MRMPRCDRNTYTQYHCPFCTADSHCEFEQPGCFVWDYSEAEKTLIMRQPAQEGE